MSIYVPVDHPRFVKAQRAIFVKRVVADCMTHNCRIMKKRQLQLDACCRYGADVDLGERNAIMERAEDIVALLRPEVLGKRWFVGPTTTDRDFPSGRYVRTAALGRGCVFLAHEQRGCAIHLAAVENGWSLDGVKPHVCRLFPLSYESDAIVLSDDYPEYSCAREPSAPSVYQVGRATVEAIFGSDLVAALDATEAAVLGKKQRRLSVLA